MTITFDKEIDQVLEDPPIPRVVHDKVQRFRPKLQRVVVKHVLTPKANPKKIVGFTFDPEETTDAEICDAIVQGAFWDAEDRAKPVERYEAWLEIQEGGSKKTKYIRFKIDESGNVEGGLDPSDEAVVLRATLQLVELMQVQNKELHTSLLASTTELREIAIPYKDAMHEMGNITSNAYKQLAYALFLVMDTQRQDKQLEIEAQKWSEGFELAKEFLPKALQQHIDRLRPDDEGEDEEQDDEDAENDEQGERTPSAGKEKGKEKKAPKITLVEACQVFGNSLEGAQWVKLEEALTKSQLAKFKKIVTLEIGDEQEKQCVKLVNQLRKSLDKPEIKSKLRKVLVIDQLGALGAILNEAKKRSEK